MDAILIESKKLKPRNPEMLLHYIPKKQLVGSLEPWVTLTLNILVKQQSSHLSKAPIAPKHSKCFIFHEWAHVS